VSICMTLINAYMKNAIHGLESIRARPQQTSGPQSASLELWL